MHCFLMNPRRRPPVDLGSVLTNNALFLNEILWVSVPGWLAGRLTQKIEPEIDIKKAISKH